MDIVLELAGNLKGWIKLWNILFFSIELEGNVLGITLQGTQTLASY